MPTSRHNGDTCTTVNCTIAFRFSLNLRIVVRRCVEPCTAIHQREERSRVDPDSPDDPPAERPPEADDDPPDADDDPPDEPEDPEDDAPDAPALPADRPPLPELPPPLPPTAAPLDEACTDGVVAVGVCAGGVDGAGAGVVTDGTDTDGTVTDGTETVGVLTVGIGTGTLCPSAADAASPPRAETRATHTAVLTSL